MNSSSVRLEKVENIIRLINKMAGSTEGVSLQDIMNEYNVCRRTAERMMNVVRALYPTQIEQVETDELYKSYRLQELYRQGPIKFSTAELACIKRAAKLAKTFMLDESFANVYVKPSVVQTIVDGEDVNITGLGDVEALDDATLGRIEIGGRYGFTTNLSAYGWANYTFGSDYDATTFGLGLNYAF